MAWTPIPHTWWHLRVLGDIKALKVSYVALAVIPMVAESRLLSWVGGDKGVLFGVFFGSLSLALANLLYDIFCPVVVKRFASPNDFYHQMLEIRDLSARLYPDDPFRANLEHCKKRYREDATTLPRVRVWCANLFLLSGILWGYVVLNRTWSVVVEMLS
jgi:hypothetical protein